MFHPTRDGCRGGKDQFNWDEVRNDKRHRMNYLGNSVKVPDSRHKDLFWYQRGQETKETDLQQEVRDAKEQEAKLMSFYLTKGLGAKLPDEERKMENKEGIERKVGKEGKEGRRLRKEDRKVEEGRKVEKEDRKVRKEERRQRREEKRIIKEERREKKKSKKSKSNV